MKTLTLNQITEQRVRAILTGSPTPASDLKALWCNLSHAEQAQALGYFGSVSTLNQHAEAESDFCTVNDI